MPRPKDFDDGACNKHPVYCNEESVMCHVYKYSTLNIKGGKFWAEKKKYFILLRVQLVTSVR